MSNFKSNFKISDVVNLEAAFEAAQKAQLDAQLRAETDPMADLADEIDRLNSEAEAYKADARASLHRWTRRAETRGATPPTIVIPTNTIKTRREERPVTEETDDERLTHLWAEACLVAHITDLKGALLEAEKAFFTNPTAYTAAKLLVAKTNMAEAEHIAETNPGERYKVLMAARRARRAEAVNMGRKSAKVAVSAMKTRRKVAGRIAATERRIAVAQGHSYTEAEITELIKARTVARGQHTRTANIYKGKAAEANAAMERVKELHKLIKREGRTRELLAQYEEAKAVEKPLIEATVEAYKVMMAKQAAKIEAERAVEKAQKANDRLAVLMDRLADLQADLYDAYADINALCTVKISTGDNTVEECFESLDEARERANFIFSKALQDRRIVRIEIRHTMSGERISAATTAVNEDGVRSMTAWANYMSKTMPVRKGECDMDTRGRYAEWLVVTEDRKGNFISSTVCENEDEGKKLIEAAEGEEVNATLFHNLACVATTKALAHLKRELVAVPVYAIRDGKLHLNKYIKVRETSAMRWQRLNGGRIVKYEAAIEKPEAFADELTIMKYKQDVLAHRRIAYNGVWLTEANGKRRLYGVLGLSSPNTGKDCEFVLCPMDLVANARKWASANASADWCVTTAKAMAYMALPGAAVEPWLEQWRSEMVKFVPDLTAEAEALIARVYPDGHEDRPEIRKIWQKVTDGQAVMSLSTTMIEKLARTADPEKLKAFVEMTSGTGRFGKLTKGSFVKLVIDGLLKFAQTVCSGATMIDGKPIDEIVLLAAMSVFKGSFGEGGSHKDEAAYHADDDKVTDWQEVGSILKTHGPNPEYRCCSTQLIRALTGMGRSMLMALIRQEEEYLKWITSTVEGVASLFDEINQKAILAHPELMQLDVYQQQAQRRVEQIVAESRQGRFHNLVQNFQAATDIFAWIRWLITGEYKPFIPAGVIVIPGKKLKKEGQLVVATRSPIKGRAALQLVRCFSSFKAAGIEYGELLDEIVVADGVCFCSSADCLMLALEMDFDGDHIQIIDNQMIVAAVRLLNAKYGKAPMVQSMLEAGNKAPVTDEQINEFIANRTDKVGVGPEDNVMTRLMSIVDIDGELTNDLLLAERQQEFKIQAAVDTGKNDFTATEFIASPMLVKAAKQPLPLGFALTQAERKGLPMPKDKNGKLRTDWNPNNVFDFIRLHFNQLGREIELDLSFAKNQQLDSSWFKLADAEFHAPIYGVTGSAFGWIRDGERNFSTVLFFDTVEEAQIGRANASRQGYAGFAQYKERSDGRGCWRFAQYACVHDDEGKGLVFDISLKEPLGGRWLPKEQYTGIFALLDARVRAEWQNLIDTEESRKAIGEFKANKAKLARLALNGYAEMYGYTLRDLYNIVTEALFTGDHGDRGWNPNWFTYTFYFQVFRKEFLEALAEGGVDIGAIGADYADDGDDNDDDCVA